MLWRRLGILCILTGAGLGSLRAQASHYAFSSSLVEPTIELQRETISPDGRYGIEKISGKEKINAGDGVIETYSLRVVRISDSAVMWRDEPTDAGLDIFSYRMRRSGGMIPPFAWSADSKWLAMISGGRLFTYVWLFERVGDTFVLRQVPEPPAEKTFPQVAVGSKLPAKDAVDFNRHWMDKVEFPGDGKLQVESTGLLSFRKEASQSAWHADFKATASYRLVEGGDAQLLTTEGELVSQYPLEP